MKVSEIRERTDRELEELVAELRGDMYRLRVAKATNQLGKDTAAVRRSRRDVARIQTVARARALGIEQAKG